MKIPTRLLVVSVLCLCLGLHSAPPEAASPSSTLEQAADDAYEFLLSIFQSIPPHGCAAVLHRAVISACQDGFYAVSGEPVSLCLQHVAHYSKTQIPFAS
jgi:hypothetical protein